MKKPYDHGYVCHLFEAVMEIVIPNTLAEERFENLQIEAFFMGILDLLVSLSLLIYKGHEILLRISLSSIFLEQQK